MYDYVWQKRVFTFKYIADTSKGRILGQGYYIVARSWLDALA